MANNINEEKEVQYYSAGVNAWFNTKLEHDKSILMLSSGGIGLLVTLLTAVGVTSVELFLLYLIAISAFILSLISVLYIFKINATHLEKVLNEQEVESRWLAFLDKSSFVFFLIGIGFSALIGLSAATKSIVKSEAETLNNKSLLPQPSQSQVSKECCQNGVNMQPIVIDFQKICNSAPSSSAVSKPVRVYSNHAKLSDCNNTNNANFIVLSEPNKQGIDMPKPDIEQTQQTTQQTHSTETGGLNESFDGIHRLKPSAPVAPAPVPATPVPTPATPKP